MSEPDHPTSLDPVFAEAAAAASRRRAYDARREQLYRERCRLVGAVEEAANFSIQATISDDDFARAWAIALQKAGEAVAEAGLCNLIGADSGWMPARLARAALRAATRGPSAVTEAACGIVADSVHRAGVRPALQELAREVYRRLSARHDELMKAEFPDLEPPAPDPLEHTAEDVHLPTCGPPAETEQHEGEKRAAGGPTKPRIKRAEAERLVAAAIANTPQDRRDKLTVRELNRATGVSVGMFRNLDSWRKLQDGKVVSVRTVPLTAPIRAVLQNQSADAANPAAAAADEEVLTELLAFATTEEERRRYKAMTPGECWQLLEQIKDQAADARRDQRRQRRER
jgi:hypothetical protein